MRRIGPGALLLVLSCDQPLVHDPEPVPAAAAQPPAQVSTDVPLGSAAALIPSGIEVPRTEIPVGPPVLILPETVATLTDRHKIRLVIAIELDSQETKLEAEARVHEFQDVIIIILSDRASTDLLNSFSRDELRFSIFDALRTGLPPRGLRKIFFTQFIIE